MLTTELPADEVDGVVQIQSALLYNKVMASARKNAQTTRDSFGDSFSRCTCDQSRLWLRGFLLIYMQKNGSYNDIIYDLHNEVQFCSYHIFFLILTYNSTKNGHGHFQACYC